MGDVPDILKKILRRKFEEIVERSTRLNIRALSQRIEGMPPPREFLARLEETVRAGRPASTKRRVASSRSTNRSLSSCSIDWWITSGETPAGRSARSERSASAARASGEATITIQPMTVTTAHAKRLRADSDALWTGMS